MPQQSKRSALISGGVLTVALGLGVIVAGRSSGAQDWPPKEIPPQPTYASAEERLTAEVQIQGGDEERQRQDAFRADYVAKDGHLEDLPIVEIESAYFGPATVANATARASAGVIAGTVGAQQVHDGFVVTTINVSDWLKPGNGPATVSVRQTGGPALQGDHEVLIQLENDPVLLPGNEYVLFLGPCAPTAPVPTTETYCVGGRSGAQLKLDTQQRVAPAWDDAPEWVAPLRGVTLSELASRIR